MAASREAIFTLRKALDKQGATDQILSVILDGSFANRTLLAEPIERTHITCRCRRNARLRFGNTTAQPGRFYAPGTFSPESIRTDHAAYPYAEASIRLTASSITVRYKDIGNVYWPGAARRRPLRLLMVAQTHHKSKGTKGQAPTFDSDTYHIITTDLERPAHEIIQAAFDRWQIEVAHREQKTVFGIGDAQVRNAQSVQRQPAFAVACYSLLHLAGDRSGMLAHAHRLLKPGGRFISSTLCLGESWAPYGLLLGVMRRLGKAPHVSIFTKETLLADIRQAGFENVHEVDVGAISTVAFISAEKKTKQQR